MLVPNAGSGKRGKRYFPAEYTVLKLLEYMVTRESDGPFSVYRLMKFEKGRWQRRDRIRLMLSRLVEMGLVETAGGERTGYRVTEEGKMEYPKLRRYLELCTALRSPREGELC